MPLISRFDPWHSSLCTCPPKLTFNPYTGCDHRCLYCYATSYIPNHQNIRIKKTLIPTLRREITSLNGEILAMSTSSDPYPTIEQELGLTRQCLKIVATSRCRLQVFTKSNIVQRDMDLLEKIPCMVALTVTTIDDDLSATLEPNAPASSKRLSAIENLVSHGIPVVVRIDPLIPFVNDEPSELISTLANIGVRHITSSTYKAKPDNWVRLQTALPNVAEKLAPLYFKLGKKASGGTMLPRELRWKIMKNIRDCVLSFGMQFGSCREELPELDTGACDGSWLLPKTKETP